MNAMILKLAFGHEVDHDRAPMVLERLGNTAAAGAIIALSGKPRGHEARRLGLLCAFGAGYSIGGALSGCADARHASGVDGSISFSGWTLPYWRQFQPND